MYKKIIKLETRIKKIKKRLCTLGDMRPGALSKQYNVCGNPNCRCKDPKNPKKHGPYYQLSYTHKGKSTTEFVRKEKVKEVKKELKNYADFKKMVQEWIDASVEIARLRKQLAKNKKS